MAKVDMKWRKCRDVSGGFITVMTLIFIVVGLLWAILAHFKAKNRDSEVKKANEEAGELVRGKTKIQVDRLSRSGTEIPVNK